MSRLVTEILRDGYAGDVTTLRWLQRLGGWTSAEAARRCLVSPETYRRWRNDRWPNPTAVRLLAIEAGYVPWIGWHGWEMHGDMLFPPGVRQGLEPAWVASVPLLLALARRGR